LPRWLGWLPELHVEGVSPQAPPAPQRPGVHLPAQRHSTEAVDEDEDTVRP
ncbi:MAG: hypothetical protein QOF53_1792, partial [Nocardioidaceae bacterium]|nr:hypothetical protein [Nocardioidaceae bacterium]